MNSSAGGSGAASPAGPSGNGGGVEWQHIYSRVEAQVEVLAAGLGRLEALNGLLHEYGDARDNINQARLHQAELSRNRWEAACKELLSPKLTELLKCDLEASRLAKDRFEIENSELMIQLQEVGNHVEFTENPADHEHAAKYLRSELTKLKQAYETLGSKKGYGSFCITCREGFSVEPIDDNGQGQCGTPSDKTSGGNTS